MVRMEESKKKILLEEYYIRNTAESNYPGTYSCDDDESWSLKKVKIIIIKNKGNEMEFDLIGVSCAIANAFRRIMISEVPSMAIEKVYVSNNTSLIKDEVLAHRLGLVPLKADARLFEYQPEVNTGEGSEQDTVEYELKIKCTVNKESESSSQLPNDLYKDHNVYSKHIKWIPIGSQARTFTEDNVKPIHDDILLNKLRPGQELDLKLHAVKGIGKDHAKFSPVATAFYRMLPEIKLLKEVTGENAELLQKCFSPGVINVEINENGEKRAVVADARYDSCSRIVFRYPELKDCVQMSRIRNHFIFTVESVGAIPPHEIFLEAVQILKNKCSKYLQELDFDS